MMTGLLKQTANDYSLIAIMAMSTRCSAGAPLYLLSNSQICTRFID